jgi:hypothetical protein
MALGAVALMLALGATPAAALDDAAATGPAPRVLRLDTPAPRQMLFVGNSYLFHGDSVHNHVARMARAAHPDHSFAFRSATISGGYLAHHDIDAHLASEQSGRFDVVILQGHSTSQSTEAKRADFARQATAMDRAIRAAGAATALYMTPAYNEIHRNFDPDMMRRLDEGYTHVGNALGAVVIPVGLAFAEAYARRPDIALHKAQDWSHPTLLGTYLGAATTFAALYDMPVVGNPYTFFGVISDEDAAFLQQVAADTVAAYRAREPG